VGGVGGGGGGGDVLTGGLTRGGKELASPSVNH